ncbi:MAG: hypothetical protein IKU43_01510 [Clostridia bacterium]|nr:hypothetical protein [Clostridia bacterium]
MYIEKQLKKRRLPDLFTFEDGRKVTAENADERRAEFREILQREIYGEMPVLPDFVRGEVIKEPADRDCAGKAKISRIQLTFSVKGEEFSFPFWLVMPRLVRMPRFVVAINFRDNMPDEYIPCEELIDRGIGFAAFCYKDVTSDDNDMTNGLAGVLAKVGYNDTGKLAMWAYSASRVLDWVLENCDIDRQNIAVAGHSRLGKTALVCGAFDERFTCAYSNDSGCSGAAITRDKQGEQVAFISVRFDYWFCKKYHDYSDRHHDMPFDQHFLLAAIAPRNLYVASALEDTWADPESEYLCCVAAGEYWKLYGKTGFVYNGERMANVTEVFHEGCIAYHMRSGVHYWSREDWNKFLDYFLK